jgi:hypothetical protein
MLRKNIGSQILLFATMAMMDDRLWGGQPTIRVKENPEKECPICHTMHDGKHLCCCGDCFRALVKKHKEERK